MTMMRAISAIRFGGGRQSAALPGERTTSTAIVGKCYERGESGDGGWVSKDIGKDALGGASGHDGSTGDASEVARCADRSTAWIAGQQRGGRGDDVGGREGGDRRG
jgi:hypothetical protein